MKILWTDFASNELEDIFKYYKENVNLQIAKKIKSGIFSKINQLKKMPQSGTIDPHLKKLEEGHRYLVQGNYKIVYKEMSEGILITDIFDSRRNPSKINDQQRK